MNKLFLSLIFLTSFAYADSYVVELKPNFTKLDIKRLSKLNGVNSLKRFTDYSSEYFDRLYSLDFTNRPKDLIAIKNDPAVQLIENDFEASYFEIRINKDSEMLTNDLLFPQQWGLYNQGQIVEKRSLGGNKIRIDGLKGVDINWKKSIEQVEQNLAKEPVVAVIDMGIDFNHPELKDAIYKNTSECDKDLAVPVEIVDRDQNGLPSDCHGWNFAATTPEGQFYPFDDKGHGTHVSGIIAGKKNNELGISGVSEKIKILPIRVTGRVDETSEKNNLLMRSPSKRIANGILYAIKMNVDVINLSLGWPKSMDTKFMRNVITEAISKGIVVVAAAGNDNSSASIYPCNYYDVICVGSINIDGKVSAFSNYGGQVDILAPGDQIISTIPTEFIPLKLNLQGYDIFSGTSQAAPFVSATVALHKALRPEITLDEIKHKIFKTARSKQDLSKSLNGLLNFSDSFEEISGSFVMPVFKELSQAQVSTNNGVFQFPLYLKNYGSTESELDLSIKSLDPNVEILQYQNRLLVPLETGKPLFINVVARVKDFTTDHSFKFAVDLISSNKQVRSYQHSLTLGLDIDDLSKMNFGFKFTGRAKPIITLDNETGEYSDMLNTVDEKLEDGDLPSYYMIQNKVEDKEMFFSLFNFDGKGFSEANKELKIKKALKFLSITKHDYNYDGVKDILVKTIICHKKCDQNPIPESDLSILYSYRTLDLEPLYKKYSDIEFNDPKGINVTPKTVRYYQMKLPTGELLAAPYFITDGQIPDNNYNGTQVTLKDADTFSINDSNILGNNLLSFFKPKDRSILRRLYRLDLDAKNKRFVTKTFIDESFINTVRYKMQGFLDKRIAIEDTNVSIVHLLNQDKEDFYQDKVKTLLSFGLGATQYNVMMTISNNIFEIIPAPQIKPVLLGNSHYDYFNLDNGVNSQSQNAMINFTTSQLMTITGIYKDDSSHVIPYRLDDPNDVIMGFLALFKTQDTINAFIEQVDTISMLQFNVHTNELKINESPIQKFSFLPGQMMTEMYFPVVAVNTATKSLEPAIYIDNTSISSNLIYLKTMVNDELSSPVRSSLFIPKNCKTKNPVQSKQGHFLFTFLCRDENGFRLKYLNMLK